MQGSSEPAAKHRHQLLARLLWVSTTDNIGAVRDALLGVEGTLHRKERPVDSIHCLVLS